jgi:hypothetical protein
VTSRHRVPTRNVSSRLLHRLAVALSVGVVGVGAAVAAPAAIDALFGASGPEPIKHVPADDTANGMIYTGLSPAKRGDPCVGGYQVTERGQCTHGPDAPPAGLFVDQRTGPVAATASVPAMTGDGKLAPKESDITADDGGITGDEGGLAILPDVDGSVSFAVGPTGVVCDGDGTSGKRVQVLYVRAASTVSRFAQYLESFRTWAAGVDKIYEASAEETGGSRHVRFVTTADCQVDVQEVEVPDGGMDTFNNTITALKTLGYNRTDRKYMIFGDANVYCGIGTFAGDEQASSANRSNSGPSYGRSDSGCWTSGVAAHELGHNLGAVNISAPNSSKAGHCLDEYDVMCYNDSGRLLTKVKCANKAHDQRLDCNHDDYFNTNPSPGSYLYKHWNVADNQFLINTDGVSTPGATPSASPSPSVSPSTSTSPDDALKALRVTETTPTSTRLSWDAGRSVGGRYAIVLNGQKLGDVRATRVKLSGMNPDTDYRLWISVVKDGVIAPYTRTVVVHTVPSANPVPSKWLQFSNSLTGNVADLFGARSEVGTPIIMYRNHSGANQQWKIQPVANGTFTIQSKATGLCVGFQRGKTLEGTPIVQQSCDNAPLWSAERTEHGIQLQTSDRLVLGVGKERYFDSRLLVLQKPNDTRYQNWTVRSV